MKGLIFIFAVLILLTSVSVLRADVNFEPVKFELPKLDSNKLHWEALVDKLIKEMQEKMKNERVFEEVPHMDTEH